MADAEAQQQSEQPDQQAEPAEQQYGKPEKSEDEQREQAQQHEREREEAKEEMRRLEESDELPQKLEDWPGGKAKYETYGGPDGQSGYDDGATSKLGPSSLRHHEDGSVSIEGEKVDNPDEYKGDPIPGGPTDPNTPDDVGMEASGEDGDEDGSPSGSDAEGGETESRS